MTRWTVWPLMSIPRMSLARSAASCGSCASLTPPALPRPPVLTWALTTTVPPPSFSADARASSGVVATCASSTGTPCAANRSRAWYSKRSTGTSSSSWRRGRRMPTTNPSPRRCQLRGDLARLDGLADVRADPVHDRLHGGSGSEDLPDAEALELGDVGLGDDPAAEDDDVVGPALPEQRDDPGEERHMRSGEHGEADGVRVLLKGGLDDLLRRLVQAGVDDLHAGVAQGAGDD